MNIYLKYLCMWLLNISMQWYYEIILVTFVRHLFYVINCLYYIFSCIINVLMKCDRFCTYFEFKYYSMSSFLSQVFFRLILGISLYFSYMIKYRIKSQDMHYMLLIVSNRFFCSIKKLFFVCD